MMNNNDNEKIYEIPGLEHDSIAIRSFRLLDIFRAPEKKDEQPQPVEGLEADVLTHALMSLDSQTILGLVDPEDRDKIIISIIAPRVDAIEEKVNAEDDTIEDKKGGLFSWKK